MNPSIQPEATQDSASKSLLRKILPTVLWRTGSRAYWWWFNRGRHQAAAVFSSRRRGSIKRLQELKNIHRGERCFILGNGPSLNQTDLSLLENEITFGLNRIYLLFPKMGFSTTYLVSINTLVLEQCAMELAALPVLKFFTWRARQWFEPTDDVVYLDTDYTPPADFSLDVSGRVFEGSTVTYVALQLAFHMGFEQVILVGVDHDFAVKGTPNQVVISKESDQSHFSPDYFGAGFRWQLPDLEASEQAYLMARQAYEAAGRQVLDATIGGKLQVFDKVDYHSLF
ncbi:MAG: DUF115 domain-containing protein [Anaerolineales bacterium]